MRNLPTRFPLIALAALVLLVPACSKSAPPAPAPAPAVEAPAPAPVETPSPQPEPAADWEEADEPDPGYLSAADINAKHLLKTVYFDYDRAEIRPDQRATLQANAAWLRDHADVRIVLEGHCDERGTRDYNMALGDRRSQATREYLISLGVDASRIETISYGEERPVAPGQDESAWSQNRRSEFVAIAAGPR